MRVMQSPWGIGLVVAGVTLAGLFLISATAALVALTVFLVRKSRAVALPITTR